MDMEKHAKMEMIELNPPLELKREKTQRLADLLYPLISCKFYTECVMLRCDDCTYFKEHVYDIAEQLIEHVELV